MYGNPFDLGSLGSPSGHDPPPINIVVSLKISFHISMAILTFSTFIGTSLNPMRNAQVCVYLTVHYICAKNVYYAVTAKCCRQHAAAYRTTQNAFPYFWSNKSQIFFLKNH